ncbi:efflux transporter outer membrane subunit [Sulfurimicrobium lacus]|nr:efflux transporter outer membrane subunit [Sulfurimicrobium lacus]
MPAKSSISLLSAVVLVGCAPLPAVSPPRPEIAKTALQQILAATAGDPAFTRAAWPERAWWRAFDDKALDALVEMALRDSPTLATAQARIDRARQAAHLVELESGIRYNSDATVVRQHLSENGLFPPPMGGSTLNEGDISVGAAYAFDWWGKNRALLRSAVGESRAAEAERSAAELALGGEVADAYFDWQDVVARSKLARQTVDKRRMVLRLAGSRLKRGIDSALPSSQMEVLLAEEQDKLKDLETQSRILRDRLAALTGNGPDWAAGLDEPVLTPAAPFPLPQKLPLDWLAQRPDLVALKWRAEAAAQRIEGARADFYPNVDLRLLLGLQSIDLGNWLTAKSWYGSFGPAVHIPLFNVRTLRTNLGMREAEYAAAAAQYNLALIVAASQVADALARVSALDARERLQLSATVSAERAQHLQAQRFASGLSDRLPLLDGEIAALAQHARESKLQADRKRAMAALFVALGGGHESNRE